MDRRRAVKLALVVVIAAVIAAIYFSPLRQHLTRNEVRAAVEQFRGVWYGPIVLIVAYAIGCVFALPASLFVIASGFIWGWKLGGLYALIGGVLGATASFFVGRFVGEGLLKRFGKAGEMVTKQVDHAGFRSLLVLRLVPGIPFAVLNYGAGAAGVRVGDYILATIIGSAPPNFVFAYCADALLNGSMSERDVFKNLIIVCGLMLGFVLFTLLLKKMFGSANPESRISNPE